MGREDNSVLSWPLSIQHWELKGEENGARQETKSLWEECGIAGQKAGSKQHCLGNFVWTEESYTGYAAT